MARATASFRGEVGERLTSGPVPVSLEGMAAYTRSLSEPGYEQNIHTDPDFARRYGLDEPIAEGRMWTTLLSTLLGSALGHAWLTTGALAVTFLKMVKQGDLITAHAVVTASGRRCEFDVWCENQRGEKVVVGTASCLIS
jgi:acyl dehydratase